MKEDYLVNRISITPAVRNFVLNLNWGKYEKEKNQLIPALTWLSGEDGSKLGIAACERLEIEEERMVICDGELVDIAHILIFEIPSQCVVDLTSNGLEFEDRELTRLLQSGHY
jgi:hypothetical protein